MTTELLKEAINNINNAYSILNSEESLNKDKALLIFHSKLVYTIDNDIYKVSSDTETITRLLLSDYSKQQGFDIFLSEKVIPDLCSGTIMTTKQEPVRLKQYATDEEVIEEIKTYAHGDIEQFCQDTGIFGFTHDNCGFDDSGKLKIFDCIFNLAVSIDREQDKVWLHNGMGEKVYERKLSDYIT